MSNDTVVVNLETQLDEKTVRRDIKKLEDAYAALENSIRNMAKQTVDMRTTAGKAFAADYISNEKSILREMAKISMEIRAHQTSLQKLVVSENNRVVALEAQFQQYIKLTSETRLQHTYQQKIAGLKAKEREDDAGKIAQLQKINAYYREQERLSKTIATNSNNKLFNPNDTSALSKASTAFNATTFNPNDMSAMTKATAAFNKELEKTKKHDEALNKNGFLHKLSTTAQYAAAGTILYSLAAGFKEAIAVVVEFDTATRTMAAVLDLSLPKAQALGNSLVDLGKAYGGTLTDIYGVALALGRAGVATDQLVAGTEVVMRMARLTGDTFEQSASAVISYQQVFGNTGISIESLGDKLAYIANVSRLSTHDIGTFSNYALSAAKSAGITVDAVGAMAAAFSNAGVNASTIGTQIRTLTSILTDSSEGAQALFGNLGVGQQQLATKMQQGASESNAALEGFAKQLAQISDEDFAKYTAGMDKLLKDSLNKLRQNHKNFSDYLKGSLTESAGALQSTDVILQGFAVTWEKTWNRAKDVAVDNLSGIAGTAVSVFNDILQKSQRIDKLQALSATSTSKHNLLTKEGREARDKEISQLRQRFELEDKLAALQKQYQTASPTQKLDIAGKTAELNTELKLLDSNTKANAEKEKTAELLATIKVSSAEIARIEALSAEAKVKELPRLKEAQRLRDAAKKAIEDTGKSQAEIDATHIKSTVLITDKLISQAAASISAGEPNKVLIDLANKRLDAEDAVLQTQLSQLSNTVTLSKGIKEQFDVILNSSGSAVEKLARISDLQEDIRKGKVSNITNADIAGLNDYGERLKAIAANEEKRVTLRGRLNKAEEAAKRPVERDDKQMQEAYLAMIKLSEEEYFLTAGITSTLAQKKFHLESTLPAMRAITELAKDEEIRAKKLADIDKEVAKTKIEINTLDLQMRQTGVDKLSALSEEHELYQSITDEARIRVTESQKLNALQLELGTAIVNNTMSSDVALKVYEEQVRATKEITAEQLRQLDISQKYSLSKVNLTESRRVEDLKLQTDYEAYRIKLTREADDIATAFYEKAESGQHITEADVAAYENRLNLIKESSEASYRGYEMQKTLQGTLNSGLADFFDIQSEGWMDFEKLGLNVLNSILQKMLYMSVVNPLATAGASAITSGLGSLAGSFFAQGGAFESGTQAFAQGGAFTEGIQAYAKGGTFTNSVVDKPTYFASGGTLGVMGEAGAEAIMPLRRTSTGDLGVLVAGNTEGSGSPQAVTVRIVNESGEELKVTKSEAKTDMAGMVIDIMIDAIARNKKGMRDVVKSA